MTNYEIEQKYRIKSPCLMREKLRRLQAKLISSGKEFNELFDKKGELFSKQSVLRLRHHGSSVAKLTFKGPKEKSEFKKRPEFEIQIEDYNQMKSILLAMGYTVCAIYQKEREEYRVGKATVTLDRLSSKAWFLEIEGTVSDIKKISKKLGLKSTDREERTYLELQKIPPPKKSSIP